MALQNAFGDIALDQTLQELRDVVAELRNVLSGVSHNLSALRVDTAGRLATTTEASVGLSATVGGTVSVNTVPGITNIGSFTANELVYTMNRISANGIRANITIS